MATSLRAYAVDSAGVEVQDREHLLDGLRRVVAAVMSSRDAVDAERDDALLAAAEVVAAPLG